MYNQRSKFQSRRPMPSRGGFRRGPQPSQLDPRLLVKKATATAETVYVSTHTFADFSFPEQLNKNIVGHGYTSPTPIQDQAIPVIQQGRDVIGIAQTGTGKTAAFLLPLIQKALLNRNEKVLIMVPTRELASQIEVEFRAFARFLQMYSVVCVGGMSMGRQIYALSQRPQFVIGTPGRLKDLSGQGRLQFGQFSTIVLDEVDRMLDMGFIREMQFIIGQLPKMRHSLFFSATVSGAVRELMTQFLTNPVTVSIKALESGSRVNQDIVRTNGKPKIEVLHDLLIQDGFSKVLLFGRTKWGIEKLAAELDKRGFKVAAIHGNKRQTQRQRALDQFKNNYIQVLLATDVASRGIDVSDVTHVINYDMPQTYDDYIHRIGRTGRADKFGTALTFVE